MHSWFIVLFQVLNNHIELKPSLNNIHNANMQAFDQLLRKEIKIYINHKHSHLTNFFFFFYKTNKVMTKDYEYMLFS